MWTDDLTLLRSLVAVVDTGSIVAAARRLGYSPAAVSRHIARVEHEVGATLFHRTARSLRPSVLARIIGDRARLLVDEADQFASSVRALGRGEDGVIRIAYFRAVGTTIMPRVLATFARERPQARIALTETALSEDVADLLRAGDADLGFVWGFPAAEADGLHTEPVLRDDLILVTAADRDDLHEDPRDLSRLVGESFSAPLDHRGSPPIVDAMFHARGLPAPERTHRVKDHAMSKSLIAEGVAIGLLPALGLSDAAPGVRRSIVAEDFRRVYLAKHPGRPHPLTPVVEGMVRDAIASYRGFGVASLV